MPVRSLAHARHSAFALLLLVGLAGCLPSSCQRQRSRALLPADSLSRQFAEALPVDTLRPVWTTSGTEAVPLGYPRTLAFAGDQLLVSDAETNAIVALSEDGTPDQMWADADLDVPYLAGLRGDTVVVYSPGAERIDLLVDGRSVRQVPLPDLPEDALRYVGATDEALYLKVLREDEPSYLARLDQQGRIAERIALPGPHWRHAGLLRAWGDSLLSLAGYRPVVDVLPPGASRTDTLALYGFDSPMLPNSRLFLTGEEYEPPLLTASASPTGDRLFVLNMRPGWLRIDVFDRQGQLQHRLVEPNPRQRAGSDFFPIDLAVRRADDGAYQMAVAVVKPEPHVSLWRWDPE